MVVRQPAAGHDVTVSRERDPDVGCGRSVSDPTRRSLGAGVVVVVVVDPGALGGVLGGPVGGVVVVVTVPPPPPDGIDECGGAVVGVGLGAIGPPGSVVVVVAGAGGATAGEVVAGVDGGGGRSVYVNAFASRNSYGRPLSNLTMTSRTPASLTAGVSKTSSFAVTWAACTAVGWSPNHT